ncbi:succinate dehydrogenase assembly factor 3, mitochondrial [Trichomonascus vanleenenianus]|uniref:Sdh7p n=1 Tax=Trichomonascus vanleenenianus TaxID=2268995 RepID=UPI003ECB5E51
MKPSIRALATRRKIRPVSPILPPLPLYRRVLRAHRHCLPADLRKLGDDYVKTEFRLHKNLDNPLHIVGFLSSWQNYAEQLEKDNWHHETLDMQKIASMSDDQVVQLYELMQAAKSAPSEYEPSA